jgi:hypothetical protein
MSIGLADIVRKYLAAAGAYGQQAPLAALGFSKQEIEDAFGVFDEDYHISRFFHFTREGEADSQIAYQINGFPQTHVFIDADVQSIL